MASDELLITPNSIITTTTITAARIERSIPDVYRLVTKSDGIYVLQGYFTWTQGRKRGGEWRDLETQDCLTAQDDVPFGTLC